EPALNLQPIAPAPLQRVSAAHLPQYRLAFVVAEINNNPLDPSLIDTPQVRIAVERMARQCQGLPASGPGCGDLAAGGTGRAPLDRGLARAQIVGSGNGLRRLHAREEQSLLIAPG